MFIHFFKKRNPNKLAKKLQNNSKTTQGLVIKGSHPKSPAPHPVPGTSAQDTLVRWQLHKQHAEQTTETWEFPVFTQKLGPGDLGTGTPLPAPESGQAQPGRCLRKSGRRCTVCLGQDGILGVGGVEG